MKNSTPMIIIGSNVDVRGASAVYVVDDMNSPRGNPMPTTAVRHHCADLYCPQGTTLSIDSEDWSPTTCVITPYRSDESGALQHPFGWVFRPGGHGKYLLPLNQLTNLVCNGAWKTFAAPQTALEDFLYDLLTALSFVTRLSQQSRAWEDCLRAS
jgi:hypothetical protein